MTLVEFLQGIANAIRTRKGTVLPINAQNFAQEILSIEPMLDDIDITENGDYDVKDYKVAKVLVPSGDTAIDLIQRNITEYTVPYGVEQIGAYSFYSFSSLQKITLPKSVKKILASAFDSCVAQVNIPEEIEELCNYALKNTGIKNVELPETLTKLGMAVFQSSSVESVTIPTRITELPSALFNSCRNLTSVSLPNTLISIGVRAFSDAYNLKHIDLPDSIETISERAFQGSGLENISIPPKVTELSQYLFSDTSISTFVIPRTITKMNMLCLGSKIPNYVVMENETPCTISSPFNTSKLSRIYVPKGTSATYKQAQGWTSYADKIVEFNNVSFRVDNDLVNNENILYSVDNGETWSQFTSTFFGLENVYTVMFKNTTTEQTVLIGTTEGGSDIATIANAEANYATPSDITIYVSLA